MHAFHVTNDVLNSMFASQLCKVTIKSYGVLFVGYFQSIDICAVLISPE